VATGTSTELSRDRNGLEILPREACLQLLAAAHIGRVALNMAAMPVVLPVNFALFEGDIVIRTGPGSKLSAAIKNAVVGFEVDDVDPLYHTGWSVLVCGMAREIVDPEEMARVRRIPLTPWAGDGDHFVRIPTELVSGRRLSIGNLTNHSGDDRQ
jgi:nitroimidazol reductase NimA-like FMN-containing flavoprotein (pyridoxamine 5'-phosphate oxidase superfamily)